MLPMLWNDLGRFPLFFEEETARSYAPALDVYEHEDRYELKLDVPGVAKEDLKVTFEDGVLTLTGERKTPELPEKSSARCERWSGSFTRSFQLPDGIDPAAVEASLKDGVLTFVLKKAEAAKPRQIPIN